MRLVLVVTHNFFGKPEQQLAISLMVLLCYGLALVVLGLDRWRTSIARWVAIGILFSLISVALSWLGLPNLYPLLMVLPHAASPQQLVTQVETV